MYFSRRLDSQYRVSILFLRDTMVHTSKHKPKLVVSALQKMNKQDQNRTIIVWNVRCFPVLHL